MAVKLPSVTDKVMFEVPHCKYAEVKVTTQFGTVPLKVIPATGISVVLVEVALSEPAQVSVLSISLTTTVAETGTFSSVTMSAILLIVGASFTGVTVTWKVELADWVGTGVPLSVTVNVMVTGPPLALAVGVTVTKQFGEVPLMTTLALGMIDVFEEVPATFPAQVIAPMVSLSSIVKASEPVLESSLIV